MASPTYRVSGRQKAYENRSYPHHHQRDDQHRLAADPVSVVAEDYAPQGTGDEADAVGAKGGQRPHERISIRKASDLGSLGFLPSAYADELTAKP